MDLIILLDFGFVNQELCESIEGVMLKYGVMQNLSYGKYVRDKVCYVGVFHINKKIVLLYVVLVASLITSCSPRNQDRIEEESGKLDIVNIYMYRNDSGRVQPELINVQSDPDLLKTAAQWAQGGEPEPLPNIQEIELMYVFQYQFRNGDTIQDVYYMYVTDTSNGQYMKEFEGSLKKDMDKFDASEKERILNLIGLEGWKRVSASDLLNS